MAIYADYEFYKENGNTQLSEEDAKKALKRASDTLNAMAFGRIESIGFEKLSEFQQRIIKECCCDLADFQTENSDLLDSVISAYNLNGVSVNFEKKGAFTSFNGAIVPNLIYSRMISTGLLCGVV